jgi:hypothetical protein
MRNNVLIKHGLMRLLIFVSLFFSTAYAETAVEMEPGGGLALHVWDRYVRRFRRDHNFSVSTGYQIASWHVLRFGDFTEKTYHAEQTSLSLDYTFHILISGKTGYFLGSSAGYAYTKPDKIDKEFQPSTSWLLPGARAGIAYNYDPSGRFFAGVGAQLERFNSLRTHRLTGDWQAMAITGESFQIFGGVDLFFALDTAIHLSWVDTTTVFQKPTDASDFLVDARMTRRTQGGELGLLYHFL